MTKKIMLVFGTRPEAIKMAPLFHALSHCSQDFAVSVCVTAQHRHMLDQVLDLFDIRPDFDLNLMKPGQDLFDITCAVLSNMAQVLRSHRPDVMLVHGDTTTSFAAATAGFYMDVPVGHVEAGLRTYDLRKPFPEEFNRQIVTKVARWHFAPTEASRTNLLSEGVSDSDVFVTGNTVIDALFWSLDRLEADEARRKTLDKWLSSRLGFNWKEELFVLITGHRRENFGDGFLQICSAIQTLSREYPDLKFVYPVHLNPNVQKPVKETLGALPNVYLIEPLDYQPFVYLLSKSYLVLTDSGGVQEEAPSLGKPVLVMREVTERPEAVTAGTVRLVGADKDRIVDEVARLVDDKEVYKAMSEAHNPYGDGKASERILSVLKAV